MNQKLVSVVGNYHGNNRHKMPMCLVCESGGSICCHQFQLVTVYPTVVRGALLNKRARKQKKSIYLREAKISIVKGREYLRSPYNYKTLQIN